MSYFRENIEAMRAYVPGEQPRAGQELIKLNTNENPYPPSPAAMDVLRRFDADALRRYPDSKVESVRQAAAKLYDLPADWIIVGNGSDDLIMMIARACADSGRAIAYPVPTFEFYFTQAQIQCAKCIEVPFDDDFNLPVAGLAEADAAVTFVANPNSPSGTAAGIEQLDELAEKLAGVLVIDEAYVDFAETNAMDLVRRRDNVIILRTLSKGYSLAGLRLGLAIAQPALLAGLVKTKAIYTVGALACELGAAALADQRFKTDTADKIKATRSRLAAGLEKMGFRVWPSQTNFLLTSPPDGQAEQLAQNLKKQGILVRYYNDKLLDGKLRITVGTDEQTDALLEALATLFG